MSNIAVVDRELHALVSLLETEDESTVAIMLEQMRSFSEARLRRLATLASPSSPVHSYVNLVLAERHAPRLQAAFLDWVRGGADLEQGIMLVEQTGYPMLVPASIQAQLDALALRIRRNLPWGDPVALVEHLASVIGDEEGFRGDDNTYYEADNSYLNRVLERRMGLPITLSVLYMLLGARLGLSIAGIPLPTHFIAALTESTRTVYFDPFRGGAVLESADILRLFQRVGRELHPNLLRPATSVDIIRRTLANLERAYDICEDIERASLVRQYLAVLK